jgi:hypothetical protein
MKQLLIAFCLFVSCLLGQEVVAEPSGNPFNQVTLKVFDRSNPLLVVEITGKCVRLGGVKNTEKNVREEDLTLSCHLWRLRMLPHIEGSTITLYTLRGYWNYHPEFKARLPENHPGRAVEGDAEGYTISENGKESPFIPQYFLALTWAQNILDAQVDASTVGWANSSKAKLLFSMFGLSQDLLAKR